jgi:hypothetical protein
VVHGMVVWAAVAVHGVGAVIVVHRMVVWVVIAIHEVVGVGAHHHW